MVYKKFSNIGILMRFIYLTLILLVIVEVILCKQANPFND